MNFVGDPPGQQPLPSSNLGYVPGEPQMHHQHFLAMHSVEHCRQQKLRQTEKTPSTLRRTGSHYRPPPARHCQCPAPGDITPCRDTADGNSTAHNFAYDQACTPQGWKAGTVTAEEDGRKPLSCGGCRHSGWKLLRSILGCEGSLLPYDTA